MYFADYSIWCRVSRCATFTRQTASLGGANPRCAACLRAVESLVDLMPVIAASYFHYQPLYVRSHLDYSESLGVGIRNRNGEALEMPCTTTTNRK